MRIPCFSLIFPVSLIVLISLPAMAKASEATSVPAAYPGETTKLIEPQQVDNAGRQLQMGARQLVYQPPRRSAPLVRVGGGTRGEGDRQPTVYVLVPEHTGLTTKPQPDLFWYSSGATAAKLEFALIDERSIDPVFETSLDPAATAGIHRISLAAYGIELSPGKEYQWSVALIPDEAQRSRDLVATGRIESVLLAPALAQEVTTAAEAELPFLYARKGLWYDALATLSALIDTEPDKPELRRYRAALLEQVGLHDVAKDERPH